MKRENLVTFLGHWWIFRADVIISSIIWHVCLNSSLPGSPVGVIGVILLTAGEEHPCGISDRWIIYNPECTELRSALNPPDQDGHVSRLRSRQAASLLSNSKHITTLPDNNYTQTDRWCYHVWVTAPNHIITHPHNTLLSITSSRPQCGTYGTLGSSVYFSILLNLQSF